MKNKVIKVCCVAGFLGLLSFATGIAAEINKLKSNQVTIISAVDCSYPKTAALGYGLTAAFALMIAQIILNLESGCVCFAQGPPQSIPDWDWDACSFLSWLTFIFAYLMLLTAAALNNSHGVDESGFVGNYYCYVVKPGVFAAGAILSLASVVLGMIYYVMQTSAEKVNPEIDPQGGIAMVHVQPQFPPPQNAQEDIYRRQHIP